MHDHLAIAKRYLSALERFVDRDELAQFFTPDVIQIEFPNRLTPNGATRDLNAILEGSEQGKKVLTSQSYEITNVVDSPDQLVLELIWTGTLAVPLGTLQPGSQMCARFAAFLAFRDGKIAAQRNYDCFDPW